MKQYLFVDIGNLQAECHLSDWYYLFLIFGMVLAIRIECPQGGNESVFLYERGIFGDDFGRREKVQKVP